VSDQSAGPHMAAAIGEIIAGNGGADGDYLIVAEAVVDGGGWIYSWRWAWSPQAPRHDGEVPPPPG
jgi:hypothetical protein